ncbi:transcriptional repressor LexA [Benzoatithermus flavus]|uniref:LexA repressor n=1 Tax=Benzoatithermus flavus TaxID=3108223 RepID=A0ABU8XK22_9PROT
MLTQRQLQLLKFIEDYVREHNVSPSFEEMRFALRLRSKSGIHRLIQGLEERGYIRRLAYRARALEVVKPVSEAPAEPATAPLEAASNVVRGLFRRSRPEPALPDAPAVAATVLPLYGRIAAGTPIEALADTSASIEVPSLLLGHGEHYVLQVTGDSMIEAGIFDGDLAIIQRCDDAENGAIVVALVDDREVTLKRLRRRGASIALEPANANYEIRIFGPHQVKIQGRLVGLLRRY